MPPLLLLMLLATAPVAPQAIQDSRCYLSTGGAVESFYISEDTPVGSVIGTLSVNGSPRLEDGDITLRVQEPDAALGVAPGGKELTLLKPLDRERVAGPAALYVNVRCDRRGSADPSFIIPVSVRVWDVNDNAPEWVGAPYRVRLSEATATGARLPVDLKALDRDQAGPHATLHYRLLPSPHAEYFEFPNELESILVVKKPLDYETAPNLTVTLRASDGGTPPLHADATLNVELLDADDQNPAFTYQHYTAILPADATEDTELVTSPGPISAADQDRGINAPVYYAEGGEGGPLLRLHRDSGTARATSALLRAVPATVVIRATQYDNPDRYALATIRITRASPVAPGNGAVAPSNDPAGASGTALAGASETEGVRFSQREYSVSAREDAAPGSVLATLATNRDPSAKPPLQFYVSERSFLQQFALDAAGRLLLRAPLDYELQTLYHYRVMVTDGNTNDTASLNITVLNVNEWEPRFKYPQYEFRAPAPDGTDDGRGADGAGLVRVGRLDAFDGDRGDRVLLTLRGPAASMFYLNGSGELFMKSSALRAANSSVLHVLATATDSGSPPLQSSVPVLVHVPGTARSSANLGAGGAALAASCGGLALLLLLAAGLLYRRKRAKASAVSQVSPSGKPPAGHLSPPVPHAVPPGVPPGAPYALGGAQSGSLLSVSAGASSILAASSTSLDQHDHPHNNNTLPGSRPPTGKSRVAPLPPSAAVTGVTGGNALLSDHVGGNARGRSGVAWPADTIPARVKKLSWDDADRLQGGASAGPPPQATHPAVHDHMNLTVYF